jgi:hypothetical protein
MIDEIRKKPGISQYKKQSGQYKHYSYKDPVAGMMMLMPFKAFPSALFPVIIICIHVGKFIMI